MGYNCLATLKASRHRLIEVRSLNPAHRWADKFAYLFRFVSTYNSCGYRFFTSFCLVEIHDQLSRVLNGDVARRFNAPLHRLYGEPYAAMRSLLWRRYSSHVQSPRWLVEKKAGKLLYFILVAAKMAAYHAFSGRFGCCLVVFLWHI